jgi:hypothetical protein
VVRIAEMVIAAVVEQQWKLEIIEIAEATIATAIEIGAIVKGGTMIEIAPPPLPPLPRHQGMEERGGGDSRKMLCIQHLHQK